MEKMFENSFFYLILCILLCPPWRNYRIGIHSESIRTIPISVFNPIRKTFRKSFDEKREKIDPT